MEKKTEIFDPSHTVLNTGVHLIEASAGTGKTYTITMLVLRLVVEYSVELEKILLVTFTRAATAELAARIRSRLIEAKVALEEEMGPEVDATLSSWLETIEKKDDAIVNIKKALTEIDRASIFTIHGFCQRVLQEQAMESGQLFDVALRPDIAPLRITAAQDYWRNQIYPLEGRIAGAVVSTFSSPEILLSTVPVTLSDATVVEPSGPSFTEAATEFEKSEPEKEV